MAEHPPEKFKFRVDDDLLSEPLYPNQTATGRGDGKNRRGTIIFIVLLMAIAGAFAYGYYDLRHSINYSQNTGSMEVTNLSKDLDSRFSSLSLRQAKLEERLTKQTDELKKDRDALKSENELLKNRLKESEDNLVSLNKELDGKSDKKNVSKQIKRLAGSLAPLDAKLNKHVGRLALFAKDIDGLNTKLQAAKEDILGEINELNRNIDETSKTVIGLRSELTQLSERTIPREALDRLMLEHTGKVRTQLTQAVAQWQADLDRVSTSNRVDDTLAPLAKRVLALEKEVLAYEGEILRIKRSLKTFQAKFPATLTRKGSGAQSLPTPQTEDQSTSGDNILEQDISD